MGEQRQANVLKNKKFRRRSLDESLINPIKAFVGSNRHRRQSTTDAVNFQRGALFYSSDRRRKKSDNELFARFQDTTKERIRTAVTRSSSCKENEIPVRKNTPTMLRRISKHLIRAYTESEKRNSITELPNENDETRPNTGSPILRYNGKSYDTSSLSTTDSGIELRDDKTISSDERSDEELDREKILGKSPNILSRSLSFDNITKETDVKSNRREISAAKTAVRRQLSLREERINQNNSTVSPSRVHLENSIEKLNKAALGNNSSENYSSDEKISQLAQQSVKNDRKKKKIFQPLVKKIRRVSRNETPHQVQQPKVSLIDNTRLEQIVSDIIAEKMKSLDYDHKQSNDRCRLMSTTIENTLKLCLSAQPGNPGYKVIAIVYIGETRDQGICFATQCSYEPHQDLFATATYQHENMFVCATVMASRLHGNL